MGPQLTGRAFWTQHGWTGQHRPINKKKNPSVTDDKVENKLRITYEQLNSFQRHIFLDIACFLFGEDKRIASYMWDELQLYPSFEVEMLCLMSMVKIGDDNRMWIHDQLRKLGRKIAQEDCMKQGNNSRLWATEARKIFKQDEVRFNISFFGLSIGYLTLLVLIPFGKSEA